MVKLQIGQERYAFLGGVITDEMRKSRKGAVKVKILDCSDRSKIVRAKILKNNAIVRINIRCVLPFSKKKEEAFLLNALKSKFNKEG